MPLQAPSLTVQVIRNLLKIINYSTHEILIITRFVVKKTFSHRVTRQITNSHPVTIKQSPGDYIIWLFIIL